MQSPWSPFMLCHIFISQPTNMIEYSMSINDSTFMSLPFVYFSLRIYYFFIYKPNLLLKNIKFFSFKYLIWSFVLINMDNTPTVNARERCECENVRGWKNGYAYQTASPLACCLVNLLSCLLVYLFSCLFISSFGRPTVWWAHQQMNLNLLRNLTWCRTDGLDDEKQG